VPCFSQYYTDFIKCDVQVTVHRDRFFGMRNSEPSRSCLQAVNKPVWHIISVCTAADDEQRNCLKHVEFYSKNKFEKLVHLVGFIIGNILSLLLHVIFLMDFFVFYIFTLFYVYFGNTLSVWQTSVPTLFNFLSYPSKRFYFCIQNGVPF